MRSSIRDPADWAEVERPDNQVTPDGQVVILFSDIEVHRSTVNRGSHMGQVDWRA